MSLSRRDLLGMAATAGAARAQTRPPNIVLFLYDDLGYGDLGCYGQKYIQTQNSDRVAREGTRFTDCYAGGVVCAPSRSTLMTGLHTGHTPVRANAGTVPIAAGDITVAQVLKSAGYATGGFGKWGLGDARSPGIPTRHGFDEFFGYLHQVHAHDYYPEFLWDNEQKYAMKGRYSGDVIAERSFEFLRNNRERPFFLYATYTLPHAKFEIPSVAPYGNRDWTQGQKTYAAMVTKSDTYLGHILDLLREYRVDENTIVFVTSDNGAHSGEGKGFEFFRSNGPLRGEKGQVYEGGIRVPMIVRWPGKVKAGATSDYPWAFWDFTPTAAELAGWRAPDGIDGISMVPLLRTGRRPKREFLYWEADTYDMKAKRFRDDRLAQAVRMGDWKGVRTRPGVPLELYNLRRDIREAKNVAAENPQIVARLESYLETARTQPRPHDSGIMQWVK